MKNLPSLEGVQQAVSRLNNVIRKTPWEFNKRLSAKTNASVFIKREDLQQIRSFKIRGAYNKISSLNESEREKELFVQVQETTLKALLFPVKIGDSRYSIHARNDPTAKSNSGAYVWRRLCRNSPYW